MKKNFKIFIPIIVFLILLIILGSGLKNDPRLVPSVLIDKPVPEFALEDLETGTTVNTQDLKGQVWLLNVWASWCVGCLEEHEYLVDLSNLELNVPWKLVGFNYKDDAQDAVNWLNKHGNPYHQIITDKDGRTGIDLGVYGVPETFVIDKNNRIRYKHIGPVDQAAVDDIIIPLIHQLNEET